MKLVKIFVMGVAVGVILSSTGCHAYQQRFIDKFYGVDDCQRIDAMERELAPPPEWIVPQTSGYEEGPVG